jgi:hypothetical protein
MGCRPDHRHGIRQSRSGPGRALAYAAALRSARFGPANEHSDWETAHHAFTYCNALHQLLKRVTAEQPVELESPELLRGLVHGATRLYLIRFLNVPSARLLGEADDRLDELPSDDEALRAAFLVALDRQGSVRDAGRLVTRYLAAYSPTERAQLQTAMVAHRLSLGEALHEAES